MLFGRVTSLLRSFTHCKPTNQRTAHLYIHEHTIKGENLAFFPGTNSMEASGGIEQHPGHFQPNQCYISYSETLRNSVKYHKNPVNHPFKHTHTLMCTHTWSNTHTYSNTHTNPFSLSLSLSTTQHTPILSLSISYTNTRQFHPHAKIGASVLSAKGV